MKITPRTLNIPGSKRSLRISKTFLVASILSAAQSLSICSAEGLDLSDIGDNPANNLLSLKDGQTHEYDYLHIEHAPLVDWNQHTVNISQNSALKIFGDTEISLTATRCPGRPELPDDAGNYALTVDGDGASAELLGNVSIVVKQSDSDGHDLSSIGANAIYALNGGRVSLGTEGTTTKLWVFAQKPDSISAKLGAQVNFKSTNNQIVGSMDLLGTSAGDASSITGTFSGADSYWFGDEFSRRNGSTALKTGINWGQVNPADGILDLTFENGAQWSYLGFVAQHDGLNATVAKRISSITLRNGGIINLYDKNLEEIWKSIRDESIDQSLYDALSANPDFDLKHDYVRIGDLKGSGGIFRIDTNGKEKSQTDVIFVENSTEGGTHHIQIEGLDTLGSITEDNTLTFAMVSKAASDAGVAFHEIENVEGDKLFNYELDIRGVEFSGDDAKEIKAREEFSNLGDVLNEEFLSIDFPLLGMERGDFADGGTRWEIYRVVRSNSASTLGMIGSGYAGYDLAVEMDRRDRRIHEAVLENGADKGLWVRMNHGQMGASGVYKNDVDTVTIGFEGAPSASSRFGGWFSYATGDVDYSNVKGSADLTRYEAALYGTLLSGNHYLDLVGRFGRVKNEFDVSSNSGAIRTTGDYDQDYAALSAEYGYTLRDASTGVFLEPQLQIQAAYLRDFDYSTERGMRVHADAETSVIGRAGFRFGRQFRTAASVGEAYLRGDVLHQWTDGQEAVLKADADRISTIWGDKDTWADFGVGAFWNWKDRFSLQLDLERTVGGETVDTWQMSGRASLLF